LKFTAGARRARDKILNEMKKVKLNTESDNMCTAALSIVKLCAGRQLSVETNAEADIVRNLWNSFFFNVFLNSKFIVTGLVLV
jgi:hypothetical protein